MDDYKPSSGFSPSLLALQDWELCLRLEAYNVMFRPVLEKFRRDIKVTLTHLLTVHNETCGCHIDCAPTEMNRVWNQKKVAFMELHKLSGLSFEDFLSRILRLLLNSNIQNVEPLHEPDFWLYLRQPFSSVHVEQQQQQQQQQQPQQQTPSSSNTVAVPAAAAPAPAPTKGTPIDDEEFADIQNYILNDIDSSQASSSSSHPHHSHPHHSHHQNHHHHHNHHLNPHAAAAAAAAAAAHQPHSQHHHQPQHRFSSSCEVSPSAPQSQLLPATAGGGGGGSSNTSAASYDSSPTDPNDELIRLKRKEKHMAPIDCTGISSSYGLTWFCKLCERTHVSKSECRSYKPFHQTKIHIPNTASHHLGLPGELRLRRDGVYTNQSCSLKAFTRLGPLVGSECEESKMDFDEDRSHIWLLYKEDGSRRCLLTSEDTNWVSKVTSADASSDANCLAVSMKNQIYLVTTEEIGPNTKLKYFSKEDPTTEFWTSWTQAWANQKRCTRCSVHGQFESVADYRVHISLWHDLSFQGNPQNRIYYCPDCNAKHIGAKDIVQHCKEAHNSLPFQCKHCTKRFETYNSLIKHKNRIHCEEKPMKKSCEKCGKVYLDPKALKQHVKQVHERSEQLHCGQCEMILSSKYALNRHVKEVHHKQQEHVCPKCHKHFTQQSNLKQHLLIHWGVKPFLCEHASCKSAFTTKQCLQVHYRKVHHYTDENMPEIRRQKTMLDDLKSSPSSSSGNGGHANAMHMDEDSNAAAAAAVAAGGPPPGPPSSADYASSSSSSSGISSHHSPVFPGFLPSSSSSASVPLLHQDIGSGYSAAATSNGYPSYKGHLH